MVNEKSTATSKQLMLVINVKKQLGQLDLNLDVQLPLIGVTAVFGRSGAGKTSLINLVGGLSTPDEGMIALGDKVLFQKGKINLPPEKRNIGYVFQESRLFPHYSVKGNLEYGCKRQDRNNRQNFHRVVDLLGIAHLLKNYPATLSGGEKQRVAIGRALLTNPEILLMDEPLASLDLPRKRELLPYLHNLAHELKLPIIYVSHSLDEILRLANHMLVLDKGQVVANDTLANVWNSDLMRPWQEASEQSSLLAATIHGQHETYAMTQLLLDDGNKLWVSGRLNEIGKKLRVRIFANHVSICKQPPIGSSIRNLLKVSIVEIREGNNTQQIQLKLKLGLEHLWANITLWAYDELNLNIGSIVYAQIKGVNMSQDDMAQSI